jgi:DNA adenine methylase
MKKKDLIPPFRYMGGKGSNKVQVNKFIPRTSIYVEPYAGAANLFFYRQPVETEVLNELNSDIFNLYSILRDDYQNIEKIINLTFYSRKEFSKCLKWFWNEKKYNNELERFWAFYTMFNQGFGGIQVTSDGSWGREILTSTNNRASATSRSSTRNNLFAEWHSRLKNVNLYNQDALDIIKKYDSPDTVFYLDPPYVESTRKSGEYKHEMSDSHHQKLIDLILNCKGSVTLSGYNNEIYKQLEDCNWKRFDFATSSSMAGRIKGSKLQGKGSATKHAPRTESIWINSRCQELLGSNKIF